MAEATLAVDEVSMTPRELVFAHRYAAAAAECDQLLGKSPGDLGLLAWHATAMLCLGRLPEALEELRVVNAREGADLQGSHRSLKIGGVLWLLARRDEAIATFEGAVRGVQDGTVKYGDFAGGVSQGVLLWYAGVSVGNAGVKDQALAYLEERATNSRIKAWPGPLALFVLGRLSEEELLIQAAGARDVDEAIRIAATHLLKRRQLVNALFGIATSKRDQGSEEECLAQMRRCAALENPIEEIAWYLARGEVSGRG